MGQILYRGPWQIAYQATDVLCPDGKLRNARITGQPDTYFTIPASVKAHGKTVSGFLSYVSQDTAYYNDPVLTFHPYLKGKNGMVFPMAYTFQCEACRKNVRSFDDDGSKRFHVFSDKLHEMPDVQMCHDCYLGGHAWDWGFRYVRHYTISHGYEY